MLASAPQGGKRAVWGLVVISEASFSGKDRRMKELSVAERVRGIIWKRSRGAGVRAQAYDADAVVASVAAQKMGEDPVEAAKRLQLSPHSSRLGMPRV
ncbi:hypothetical protein CBR_g28866 [Chara braunii]|uniref:Uncharacterized protein n=1 Tax=Chara braunii TaxID=69332 RepID=A0A388LA12_CHABU|nr:hypothetical protein CBR_g28866 [Chara braunii]|eukprot:GBG79151.1 hypothetical protein CBR_g28866 [Chara braunii]